MDDSKVALAGRVEAIHGGEVRPSPAAYVMREIHVGRGDIRAHAHDHVTLTLPILGGFHAQSDIGEATISGASAVLHPARSPHAATIGEEGLEAIDIYIDPQWLRRCASNVSVDRTWYWTGGKAGVAARSLARALLQYELDGLELARRVQQLFAAARSDEDRCPPGWLHGAEVMLEAGPVSVAALSRKLDLHPAWLARSYRHFKGEGLHETIRRRRVEHAVRLLRSSKADLALVSAEAGFCDQSHMSRCFRSVLGRTPLQVRRDDS